MIEKPPHLALLAAVMGFTPEDLALNRVGCLSDSQNRHIRHMLLLRYIRLTINPIILLVMVYVSLERADASVPTLVKDVALVLGLIAMVLLAGAVLIFLGLGFCDIGPYSVFRPYSQEVTTGADGSFPSQIGLDAQKRDSLAKIVTPQQTYCVYLIRTKLGAVPISLEPVEDVTAS